MSDQIVDTFEFDNTPDGGSTTEIFQSDLTTEGSIDNNNDTVEVLEGFDRRRGFRKEPSFRILKNDALDRLMPLMTSRKDVKLTVTWKDGSTTILEGCKAIVRPVTAVRPDFRAVWYDTDTSATDTPSTDSDSSWTKLSEPLGNFEENPEVQTTENARGLPYYVEGTLNVSVPMFYDGTALSNLRTEDNADNEIRLAVETQAGGYLIFGDQSGGGVEVEVGSRSALQPDEVGHFTAKIYQTADFSDLITNPANASDLFFGAEIDLFAFAQNEGDILTENR